MLQQQQCGQDDNVRIALVAMSVRIYRTHQAVCKLVASDLNDAAAAVLRSLLEQYFVLVAVIADPQNLEIAAKQAEGERFKALTGLKNMRPEDRGPLVTDNALDEALAGITAKNGYNVWEWAQKANCIGVYHTLWRRLCGYAHGCFYAIEEYVATEPDGVVHGITSVVERTSSIDYVITSSGLLLEAIEAVVAASDTSQHREHLEIVQTNCRRLRERYDASYSGDFDAPA